MNHESWGSVIRLRQSGTGMDPPDKFRKNPDARKIRPKFGTADSFLCNNLILIFNVQQ
jgi:hypothetical protein